MAQDSEPRPGTQKWPVAAGYGAIFAICASFRAGRRSNLCEEGDKSESGERARMGRSGYGGLER